MSDGITARALVPSGIATATVSSSRMNAMNCASLRIKPLVLGCFQRLWSDPLLIVSPHWLYRGCTEVHSLPDYPQLEVPSDDSSQACKSPISEAHSMLPEYAPRGPEYDSLPTGRRRSASGRAR